MIDEKRCWIAMFSQTGSELQEVCKQINRWPDVVITNAATVDETAWSKTMLVHISRGKISGEEYNSMFEAFAGGGDPLITLHGWLKIVPAEVCKRWQIFNGHPGDIVKFPQLKGKDPQKKAFELKLPWSGCVIHRVTADVDGGPIVLHNETCIMHCKNEQEVIATLKKTSIVQWKTLINTLL